MPPPGCALLDAFRRCHPLIHPGTPLIQIPAVGGTAGIMVGLFFLPVISILPSRYKPIKNNGKSNGKYAHN